jgi:hypothetical protein
MRWSGWRDHDTGLKAADDTCQRFARARSVLDPRIRKRKCLASAAAEHVGRLLRFGASQLRRAAGSQLTLCKIEDCHALPAFGRLDQRPATRELDVVAVGRYGED